MINTYRKLLSRHQHGAAILIMTVIVLVAAISITIFATVYIRLNQKTALNQYTSQQTFSAAEAGLEAGIQYLNKNITTIKATASGGFINYGPTNANLTNVTLANNSKYSVVYTNPTINNYNTLLITSTGTSADNTGTEVVKQLVYYVAPSMLYNTANILNVGGAASSGQGTPQIINNLSSTSVSTGKTLNLVGNANTKSTTGSSDKFGIGSDVQQNVAEYQGLTPDGFFNLFFGVTSATVKSAIANFYASGSNPSLGGMMNTSIWVNGDYTGKNITIGSVSQPVLLIVNGNANFQTNFQLYGIVFAFGNINMDTGKAEIFGSIGAGGQLTMQGPPTIIRNNDYSDLLAFLNLPSGNYYAKVPGSWKDF